jgi:hypothetical protein
MIVHGMHDRSMRQTARRRSNASIARRRASAGIEVAGVARARHGSCGASEPLEHRLPEPIMT